jgi:flavin-dependent dehydrogenase
MKPIQIVGGGLAGLSLGIALRKAGVPVSIMEAGSYPRHRVCGEFVSGRGRDALRDLGLEKELLARGAREARTAAFYSRRAKGKPRPLPQPALCLSRFEMDEALAEVFRGLGGDLTENKRWHGKPGPGVVRATGRMVAQNGNGWKWFGLKAHARGVQSEADLEMHLLDNGYVGLCRLSGNTVNVCGLFRSQGAAPELANNWRKWLRGPKDSELRKRLEGAEFDADSFCATAGLNLAPQSAVGREECRVGDAITMIAPLTGNGMSMAFESSQIAAASLFEYSEGRVDWATAKDRIATSCDAAFRQRLFWGRQMQQAVFQPGVSDGVVWLGTRSGLLWRELFNRTR